MVSHMVKMGKNFELSLRVSSFVHLDLNHYRTSPERITFTLMQTKTTRQDEPVVDGPLDFILFIDLISHLMFCSCFEG